jgi:hypothetical protein
MNNPMNNQLGKRIVLLLSAVLVAVTGNGCISKVDSGMAPGGNANTGGSDPGGASTGGSDSGGSNIGGESGGAGAQPCQEGFICQPSGFPFVGLTFAHSDHCSGADCPLLTQPEPGTLCLSGAAPVAGADPHFPLIFGDGGLLPPFDAAALGITQVSFTIDSPPPAGVFVEGGIVWRESVDCRVDPRSCIQFGFYLPPITEAGTTIAAFTDFVQRDPASPYQSFDPQKLSTLKFGVHEGAYSFCLRDFKFLDAADHEVVPPPFDPPNQ